MEDLRITYDSVIVYIIVFNTVLGLLFGFFPLLAGIRMQNRKYGLLGFLISVAGGAVLGVLLSFPIALLFVWLILRPSSQSTAEQEVATETETDTDTDFVP